jgi:hypothetical protein
MLTAAALPDWVLSRPAVHGELAVVRRLRDLSLLTGGGVHVVFLGRNRHRNGGSQPAAAAASANGDYRTGYRDARRLPTVTLIGQGAAVLLPLAWFSGPDPAIRGGVHPADPRRVRRRQARVGA